VTKDTSERPDTAIRARLDELERRMDHGNERLVGDLLGAVRAVLDVHEPREVGWRDEDTSHICTQCYYNNVYPCPTVREVAGKLGVEMPDD
jgi:hypothetical protein